MGSGKGGDDLAARHTDAPSPDTENTMNRYAKLLNRCLVVATLKLRNLRLNLSTSRYFEIVHGFLDRLVTARRMAAILCWAACVILPTTITEQRPESQLVNCTSLYDV